MTTDYYTMLSILRSGANKELADFARTILDDYDRPDAHQDTPDSELADMMRIVLAAPTPQATKLISDRPRTPLDNAVAAFRPPPVVTKPISDRPRTPPVVESPPSDYDPDHVLANLIEAAQADLSEFGDEVHSLAEGFLRLNRWLQEGGRLPVCWQSWLHDVLSENASDLPAIDGMAEVPTVVQLRNPDTGEVEPVMAMHMVPIPPQERINSVRALERELRSKYDGANNAFAGGVMHVLKDLRPLLYPNFFDNDDESDSG